MLIYKHIILNFYYFVENLFFLLHEATAGYLTWSLNCPALCWTGRSQRGSHSEESSSKVGLGKSTPAIFNSTQRHQRNWWHRASAIQMEVTAKHPQPTPKGECRYTAVHVHAHTHIHTQAHFQMDRLRYSLYSQC